MSPRFVAIATVIATGAGLFGPQPLPTISRVYTLTPTEGVFAYARISPSGRYLTYASETPVQPGGAEVQRVETVIDLTTSRAVFSEPGIDAYWSNDGDRMVYLSTRAPLPAVAIRHSATGAITRNVASPELGDYFSWAVRDGRDLIVTIKGNYYNLSGDLPAGPVRTIPSCPGIGTGERPLVSHDGRRVTTFVRGTVVLRDLTDCDNIVDTGVQGGKADFSWDGRYIALHVLKRDLSGYEIQVIDATRRTVRTVTHLSGSSLFPSWTRDGRLCFRYDGSDFHGFLMADHVLSAPETALSSSRSVPARPKWTDLFPETPAPSHRLALVLIWSTWSAHSPQALRDLREASKYFQKAGVDVSMSTAVDVASRREDIVRMRRDSGLQESDIVLDPSRFRLTEAANQIPTTLLFLDNIQIDRRLGAQTVDELRTWVSTIRSDRFTQNLPHQ